MKSLFDTVPLGNLTLKNRFVRSATWEGMCESDGAVTPWLIDYYRQLAEGGVGLIISGYSYVRADGKQLPGKMGIDHDGLLTGLRELTTAVHAAGGKVICQLVHAGGQTTSKAIGKRPLAPSLTSYTGFQEPPEPMEKNQIVALVNAFGEAAARAQQAGFDGVQLHSAHGYLINQFLSPLINQRQDEYGGSLTNRMRFLEEVYRAVRQAVGPDYPVTIKLTATDHLKDGFQISEALMVAKRLEELGIDAIEVSSGTPVSGELGPVRQKILTPDAEAYNAALARQVKHAVNVPVMVVGGLRSGSVMQTLLWEGDADLVSLSRPLIREPDLPQKWSGDEGYVATCISCNGCFSPGLKEGGIYCVIDKIADENRNPET